METFTDEIRNLALSKTIKVPGQSAVYAYVNANEYTSEILLSFYISFGRVKVQGFSTRVKLKYNPINAWERAGDQGTSFTINGKIIEKNCNVDIYEVK